MEVMNDHVHIFLSAPPKYSLAKIVEVLKSISSKVAFEEFPWLRKHLWVGEFWSDGYFVRTMGDKVTSELSIFIVSDIYRLMYKGPNVSAWPSWKRGCLELSLLKCSPPSQFRLHSFY